MYREARAISICSIRAFSDGRVFHALDTKEAREATWSRKFLSTIYSKELCDTVLPPTLVPPLLPPPPPPTFPTQSGPIESEDPALDISRESLFFDEEAEVANAITAPLKRVQFGNMIQQRIQDDIDTYWREKIRGLVMQGDFPLC